MHIQELNYYDEDECNAFVGTDSTVFPAYLPLDEGCFNIMHWFFYKIFTIFKYHIFSALYAFEPAICRSLGLHFTHKTRDKGLPVYVFEVDMSDESNAKSCFCRDEDTCPGPKGTIDLYRCMGIPMIGSLPHFYLAVIILINEFITFLNYFILIYQSSLFT